MRTKAVKEVDLNKLQVFWRITSRQHKQTSSDKSLGGQQEVCRRQYYTSSTGSMLMERGGDSEDDGGSAPPCPARNPSPPPGYDAEAEEEEEEEEGGPEGDAIGNTVYSKHWLFGALTRLVQVATEQGAGDPEARGELGEEDEEQLCKVWDMAADQDVARFLQEFKAADILLGAIAKSGCPRLTEICVGILGNMACFPDTCRSISENEDLGVVLLLLLSDADPPTLLETSRLLLTCLARPSAAPLWLERVRQQESVRQSLCFIMCSSTNVDLLLKVGELVDKLFDLDEELMRSWITPQAQPSTTDAEGPLHIAPCLLEAAKQLRSESPEGLEVYIHALQLLTTVDTGIQALVEPEQVGEELWALLSDVVCSDLCQPDDPAVALQEQKTLLAPVLAVLWALFDLQGRPECCCPDRNLPLVGSLTRVLQYQRECQQGAAEDQDVHLQILRETAAELLSGLLAGLPQEAVSELVRTGALTEQSCRTAARSLLPQHCTAVRLFVAVLSQVDGRLAGALREEFPCLKL